MSSTAFIHDTKAPGPISLTESPPLAYIVTLSSVNVALFGKTAKEWRDENPDKNGNMRDYATLNQLLVLANMESYNAILIEQGKQMSERLVLIREQAVKQLQTLDQVSLDNLPKLTGGESHEE